MALQGLVQVQITVFGDGTSTVFSFDLDKDSYKLLPGDGGSGAVTNWGKTNPIAVNNENSAAYTATLSGNTITITFTSAPALNAVASASIYVLFASR